MQETRYTKLDTSEPSALDDLKRGDEDNEEGFRPRPVKKGVLARLSRPWSIVSIFVLVCAIIVVAGHISRRSSRLTGSGDESASSNPIARTLNGTYAGVYFPSINQDSFLGVPFAKPPVGDLRFRRTESLDAAFSEIRPAVMFQPRCYGFWPTELPMSEDCLYLNIHRPRAIDGTVLKDLPVLVWIHGGGFVTGAADDWSFVNTLQHSVDIDKRFIIVAISYRLSALGWIAGEEVHRDGATNLGLRDQRMAMHWVKENIAAFGGDPNKIVINGQSAGAFSVGYQITAFGGRDEHLFRGAIMQSGSPGNFGKTRRTEHSFGEEHFQNLAREAGCGDSDAKLECLRSADIFNLNAAITATEIEWLPTIDGDFIQRPLSLHLEDGEFVHVPILIGANTDEGTAFAPQGIVDESVVQFVFHGYDSNIKDEQALFDGYPDDPCVGIPETMGCTRPAPDSELGPQYRRSAAFVGDFMFIADRRRACRTWAQAGLPAYSYRFNARRLDTTIEYGSCHSEEMYFRFDHVEFEPTESKRLAQLMANLWASFVVDLNPNSLWKSPAFNAIPEMQKKQWYWPRYTTDEPVNYLFSPQGCTTENDTWRLEGIDAIIANRHGF